MAKANQKFFGFSLQGSLSQALVQLAATDLDDKSSRGRKKKDEALVLVQPSESAMKWLEAQVADTWQAQAFKAWIKRNEAGDTDVFLVTALDQVVQVIRLAGTSNEARDPLVKSHFARARDAAGLTVQSLKSQSVSTAKVRFDAATEDEVSGFLVGLEIASYSFVQNSPLQSEKKEASGIKFSFEFVRQSLGSSVDLKKIKQQVLEASRLGVAVNLARHLVNLPAVALNPKTYSAAVVSLFRGKSDVKVEVWDPARLKRERMHLMLAVGGAAVEGPRLVQIKYNPKKRGAEKKPVALVGKGITFDSGGLDLKPSSAMRLMKKDMGGSAAALAVAWWAVESGLQLAVHTYLALAENAVSANSFRPGDIISSRSGQTVEIHNTDAEGRLVLADAMQLASESKPACLIDLATLTGAIKVGLGADVAGLFSNHSELAREIFDAGLKRGDFVWRMPLFSGYKGALKSPVADLVNATDGFGGAITAALFLEKFIGASRWAHFDIYAWRDSANGAWLESGGSGQGVLNLTEVLQRFVSQPWAED